MCDMHVLGVQFRPSTSFDTKKGFFECTHDVTGLSAVSSPAFFQDTSTLTACRTENKYIDTKY